jgi:hypothetical protein
MNFQKKWTTLRKTSEAELARQGADKLTKVAILIFSTIIQNY